jgi:spore germination protein KC
MKRSVFIFSVMLLVLTGCWNRRELNELAIAVGMAIDKSSDGQYVISVQVVDPNEVTPRLGTGGRAPVTIYKQKSKTLHEALRLMTTVSPRKIYLGHLRILVLGEALAEDGVAKILELLHRDQELRSDFYIILARDTTGFAVLENVSPIEKIPAQKLYKSLEVSQRVWAPTYATQLDELVSQMTSSGKSPVLTGIHFIGSEEKGGTKQNLDKVYPESTLQYHDLGVFRGDQLVGWLNKRESKGLNYIVGKVSTTVGEVYWPEGGLFVVEVIRASSKIKARVVNGKAYIDVYVKAQGNISEVQCNMDLTDPKVIKKAEKLVEKVNRQLTMESVKRARELHSDIFGFGEAVHRADPQAWKKMKDTWHDKGFLKASIRFHPDIKIWRTGNTGKSYLKEIKRD